MYKKSKKWIPEELFKKLFKFIPLFTVDVIIKSRVGVLLSKREIPPCKGCWHLPGGIIRYGERVEEAVKRVTKEETGLKVKIKKFIGIYDSPKRDPRGHVISLCFLTEPIGGKLKGSWQAKEVKFFSKLPRNIGFDHRKMLKDAGI